MGSSSSKPEQPPDITTTASTPVKKKKKARTGFDKIQHKCRKKKALYDTCYADKYGSFLGGKKKEDEGCCEDLFDEWKECVLKGVKKDRDARGLAPPNKESMLAELDDE